MPPNTGQKHSKQLPGRTLYPVPSAMATRQLGQPARSMSTVT